MPSDPRIALAEVIGCYGEPGKDGELARQYLAERGVLLVTEEGLAGALYIVTANRGYIDLGAVDMVFGRGKPFREVAAAIFAALSDPAE
jgi:hypothetical protein